jgi:hypothetical protein
LGWFSRAGACGNSAPRQTIGAAMEIGRKGIAFLWPRGSPPGLGSFPNPAPPGGCGGSGGDILDLASLGATCGRKSGSKAAIGAAAVTS